MTSGESVAFAGHAGRAVDARLHRCEASAGEPVAGLVCVGGLAGAGARTLAAACTGGGISVLFLDEHAGDPGTPDRTAMADIEAALTHLAGLSGLDEERLAVFGTGLAGTRAFLSACTSRRVSAAVVAGAPLIHPELSADRPAQPLELALNLDCPVLALYAGQDPATPAEHVQRFEDALGPSMKSYELEVLRESRSGFLDPAASGYHPETADAVRKRIVSFLRESLDLS